MTYREKIEKVDPDYIDKDCLGGVRGCPGDYFTGAPTCTGRNERCAGTNMDCQKCWNQKIPRITLANKEPTKRDDPRFDKMLELIKQAIDKGRTVTVDISVDGDVSIYIG